jgi:pimeloyl-ACP methyl ester carboxylesterase
MLRDEAMHKLGIGTTRGMRSVVRGVFLPSLRNPEYTLREKIAIWRGKWSRHSERMWDHIIATDLTAEIVKLDIPVYFFHGIHDYTVSYALAGDYLGKLQAPLKGFYTFERSAHSPIFKEPEKVNRVLQEDVLKGTNTLADRK